MHYICKGDNCKTVSDRPSICLEPSCMHRYKLLDECNCPHKNSHVRENVEFNKVYKYGLNPVNFGIAFGIPLGAFLFLLGLFSSLTGVGSGLVSLLSGWYLGYDSTIIGSVAGGLWMFVEGFLIGAFIAYLYNIFERIR